MAGRTAEIRSSRSRSIRSFPASCWRRTASTSTYSRRSRLSWTNSAPPSRLTAARASAACGLPIGSGSKPSTATLVEERIQPRAAKGPPKKDGEAGTSTETGSLTWFAFFRRPAPAWPAATPRPCFWESPLRALGLGVRSLSGSEEPSEHDVANREGGLLGKINSAFDRMAPASLTARRGGAPAKPIEGFGNVP